MIFFKDSNGIMIYLLFFFSLFHLSADCSSTSSACHGIQRRHFVNLELVTNFCVIPVLPGQKRLVMLKDY